MERKSGASYIRCTARKMRLVADVIRGKNAKYAQEHLRFIPKRSARLLVKVLDNAIANAAASGKIDASNLFIKTVVVSEGPVLKRHIPRARGSASKIEKKMSHVEFVLEER